MTARTTVVAALTAVALAAVALIARPLLPHRHTAATSRPGHVATSPPSGAAAQDLDRTAQRAARRALTCPPAAVGSPSATLSARARRPGAPSAPRLAPLRWCGPLTVTRRQNICLTPSHCVVDLVGSLDAAGIPVAIAVSVTMRHTLSDWTAIEVSS